MIKQPFDWEVFLASPFCLVFFSSVEDVLDFQRECDERHISFGPQIYMCAELPWPIYKRYHAGKYVGYGGEFFAQRNYSRTHTWLEYGVTYIPNLDDLI